MAKLMIQIFNHGSWHDAAELTFAAPKYLNHFDIIRTLAQKLTSQYRVRD